jgi:ketosteroid isomerase-like protein
MFTEDKARNFAAHWLAAWNAHDLERILTHYAETVVLKSPIAAKILDEPSGTVQGKAALRAYFQRGLEAYPDLKFDLIEVMWGVSSVVLCYVNQQGVRAAEFMEMDANGKVVRVVANYNV